MDPPVRFALSGTTRLAFQTVGDGPVDLLSFAHIPFWPSLDRWQDEPRMARTVRRLGGFSRLILWDRRGTGQSDRFEHPHSPEQDLEDAVAVLDAAGSERAATVGWGPTGPLAILLAATHPDRTSGLVLFDSFASALWHPDYPWGTAPDERRGEVDSLVQGWGTDQGVTKGLEIWSPADVADEALASFLAREARLALSPNMVAVHFDVLAQTDVRTVLPTIRVPTLVLHREGIPIPLENAAYLAEHISGARLHVLPGKSMFAWLGDWESVAGAIEEFLTGRPAAVRTDTMLATVLFTDIVGSTELAAELGDRRWEELMETHDRITELELNRYGGELVDRAGDGLFATFGGPARAIRCAAAMRDQLKLVDIAIRAGVHTGEVNRDGRKVRGLAVHVGARVSALAAPGEILVSGPVKDLIAGSGLDFRDRGVHHLKGVPNEWQLYAARI